MNTLKAINKVGYGVGDLANGLTFGMSATFLLAFYTDVLGITAAAAGTLFLVARIWDAVNDPMMGTLADRMFARRRAKNAASGKKLDKFRPFLLKGSWPVAVAAVLMFIAPSGLSMTGKLIWAYATYITWGMAYTFINIPYGSLAAVMTQDPVERSSLSIARGLGGLFGAMFGRVLVPILLVSYADDQARGYLIAMLIFGVMTVAGYIFSYFTVKETVETKVEAAQKFDLKASLGILWKNRPFMAISLASHRHAHRVADPGLHADLLFQGKHGRFEYDGFHRGDPAGSHAYGDAPYPRHGKEIRNQEHGNLVQSALGSGVYRADVPAQQCMDLSHRHIHRHAGPDGSEHGYLGHGLGLH
jgi:hypothetical protein